MRRSVADAMMAGGRARPSESMDFKGSSKRLLRQLRPERPRCG